jgi:hypothetical protein
VVKVDEFGCEVANCSVGINELQIPDGKLVLYPNPANSELTLQIENFNISDSHIEVTNTLGESQKIQISNSKIDVSHFASGVYFMSVSADGKRWVEKFVKE